MRAASRKKALSTAKVCVGQSAVAVYDYANYVLQTREAQPGKPGAMKAADMLPGSIDNPKSFIRLYQEESLCAAYNGFFDIGHFRTLLVTPIFLGHFRCFRSVNKGMSGFTSLELLRDDLDKIESTLFEDVEETLPSGQDGDDKINLAYRMAWIIAALRRELTTGASFPPDEFQSRLARTSPPTATSFSSVYLCWSSPRNQRSNPSTESFACSNTCSTS